MPYTIKINHTDSKLAENLLQFLKSLTHTKEYDFLQVIEEEENFLSEDIKDELANRYEHFLLHHTEYPEWEEVKSKYNPS